MPVLKQAQIPVQRPAALQIAEPLSVRRIAQKNAAGFLQVYLLQREHVQANPAFKTSLPGVPQGQVNRLRIQIGP